MQRGNFAPQRFVFRVLDNREWLADEPDLAAHEAAALAEAERAGLLAPGWVAYASDDVGLGAPVVLMSFIEGEIQLRPTSFQQWLGDLAGQLAVDPSAHGGCLSLALPQLGESGESGAAGVAHDSPHLGTPIDLLLGAEPASRPVFIHRDYHPTNVLWRAGAISGVVDWINACRGPAGVDVAHCRTNLAQMYGPDTADQFLDAYLEVADGFEYDPYWDVDSVLDT